MKRQVFTTISLLLFAAALAAPAVAEDIQPGQTDEVSTTQTKPHEDSDREKLRKEIKARREAERRERTERRHGHDSDGTVVVVTSPRGGGASYSSSYTRERPRNTVGVLFAPAQKDKKAAYGLQWIGPNKLGAVAWISGNLGYDDDAIDAYIPHDDYWLSDSKGTYALEALYGIGSDRAMLVIGGGLAVTQTQHEAVSNVTGWRWKAGKDSIVKPAAHASLKFSVADRVNLQFGYDTSQYAFFGLSGTF